MNTLKWSHIINIWFWEYFAKITILFICIAALNFPTYGQFLTNSGIIAGINSSTTNMKFDIDQERRIGFNIGVTKKFPLSEKFNLRTALIYNQKGFKEIIRRTDTQGNLINIFKPKVRSDYLSFNISAGFYPFKVNTLSPYVRIGPEIGYLLGGSEGTYPVNGNQIHTIWLDLYNDFTLGAELSLGFNIINLEKGTVALEFNYEQGITDALDVGGGVGRRSLEGKNNSFGISLLFLLNMIRNKYKNWK